MLRGEAGWVGNCAYCDAPARVPESGQVSPRLFIVRYTETVNHDYLVRAESAEHAEEITRGFDSNQFRKYDRDGQSMWGTYPYDVLQVNAGEWGITDEDIAELDNR